MFLPKDSERILRFITDANDDVVDINDIFSAFDNQLSDKDVIFALEKLNLEGLITSHVSDNYEAGCVALTASGRYYFEEKENCSAQTSHKNITINNSSGFNVGDNNSVSVRNGVSFDDVRQLIAELNDEHQSELQCMVDTLQDCIENSKPLPVGKFNRFLIGAEKCTAILLAIGQIILQTFQK